MTYEAAAILGAASVVLLGVGLIVAMVRPRLLGFASRMKAAAVIVCASLALFVVALVATPAKQTADGPPPSDISPEGYALGCRDLSGDEWDQKCKGKRIYWSAQIVKIEAADRLEVRAFAIDDQLFDVELRRDGDWPERWESYVGRKVMIEGVLRAPSGYAHDIGKASVTLAEMTADEQAVVDIVRAKRAAAREQRAVDQAKSEMENKADALCQDEFKRRANYPLTVEFSMWDKFRGIVHSEKGILVRRGPTAKNGFGVPARFVYLCLVKDGKVVSFVAEEERL